MSHLYSSQILEILLTFKSYWQAERKTIIHIHKEQTVNEMYSMLLWNVFQYQDECVCTLYHYLAAGRISCLFRVCLISGVWSLAPSASLCISATARVCITSILVLPSDRDSWLAIAVVYAPLMAERPITVASRRTVFGLWSNMECGVDVGTPASLLAGTVQDGIFAPWHAWIRITCQERNQSIQS